MTGTDPDRGDGLGITVAIVLLGAGVILAVTMCALTFISFRQQTDRDIAAAKNAAIQTADAETLAKVCALAAKIPDPPVSEAYEKALGCPPVKVGPSAMSTPPAVPTTSVPPAGPNRLVFPGRTNSTGGTAPSPRPGLTSPQPRPSRTPSPSMSPTTPPLLCVLRPIVQIGEC